jgi:hypothetical protein
VEILLIWFVAINSLIYFFQQGTSGDGIVSIKRSYVLTCSCNIEIYMICSSSISLVFCYYLLLITIVLVIFRCMYLLIPTDRLVHISINSPSWTKCNYKPGLDISYSCYLFFYVIFLNSCLLLLAFNISNLCAHEIVSTQGMKGDALK